MKWIDHEENLKKDGVDESEWGNYKVYKTKTDLENDIKKSGNYGVWTAFKQSEIPEKTKINRKSQRKYEIYIGGFLFYHDQEFKRYWKGIGFSVLNGVPIWKEYPDNKFEHFIYFEWGDKKDDIVLTIYINITPDEYNVDPPKPPAPPPPES